MKSTSPVIQLAGTNLHGMPIFYPDSFVNGNQTETKTGAKEPEHVKTVKVTETPTLAC